MRIAVACVMLIASFAASRAAVPDQDWVGTIHCDPIPDIARVPLNQPFRLEVRGGVARYERDVRIADTAHVSGYQERGQGVVAADGAVTLAGAGNAQASSYRSEFKGILAPSGYTRLTGVQHWQSQRRAAFDRACYLDLHRPN